MRFIIYGAGAIGGTIGACLFQNQQNVILIARGNHLKEIQSKGLTFKTPHGTQVLPIPAVARPSEIEFTKEDVVFLTMKTQDTVDAIHALRSSAGESVPVVCCQNGVSNEPMALRLFDRVYGMVVMLPASHMKPGVVQAESKTTVGILDIGCFPKGIDSTAEAIAAILTKSHFSARPDPDIMRHKYSKLLMNLGNALQVVCQPGSESESIRRQMTHEALDCYAAAGIDCASREEVAERRGDLIQIGTIEGETRGGSSSWQSIARGTGSIESDFLNGEIVLLGRRYGVPTPANRALQILANRLVREGGKPGSYGIDEIRKLMTKLG